MKKVIILISALTFATGFYAKAQYLTPTEIPSNISQDFTSKYPTLSKVDWEKDGKKYKATFAVEKYAHEVVYDLKGNVISQEFGVAVADLPSDIFTGVKKNFPTVTVEEANQIVENGRISYRLDLKDDNNQVEKVLMAPDGRVIKTITDED